MALGQRFNVVAGPNGQGKTNLLEALHLVSTSRLLRGQRDAEAILAGCSSAEATVELHPSNTLLTVRLEQGVRKRASINGLGVPKASDLLGRLPCVCVSAADMEIVRSEPAERRMFLDLELSARSPAYLRRLAIYKRALEHRNAMLRDAREAMPPRELWETWEEQLAEQGAGLREARREFVALLDPKLAAYHSKIGGGEDSCMAYMQRDPANTFEELMAAYAKGRVADVARGSSSIGPHRDDIALTVGGMEARLFGSQGQQRTLVIALKLAAMEASAELFGEPPLLLLDDIFSDLDERRRSRLVEVILAMAGQTVLTCTEPSAAGNEILGNAALFHVMAGRVTSS